MARGRTPCAPTARSQSLRRRGARRAPLPPVRVCGVGAHGVRRERDGTPLGKGRPRVFPDAVGDLEPERTTDRDIARAHVGGEARVEALRAARGRRRGPRGRAARRARARGVDAGGVARLREEQREGRAAVVASSSARASGGSGSTASRGGGAGARERARAPSASPAIQGPAASSTVRSVASTCAGASRARPSPPARRPRPPSRRAAPRARPAARGRPRAPPRTRGGGRAACRRRARRRAARPRARGPG